MGRQKKKKHSRKKGSQGTGSTNDPPARASRPHNDSTSSSVCSRSDGPEQTPQGAVGGIEKQKSSSYIPDSIRHILESGYNSTAESHSDKCSGNNIPDCKTNDEGTVKQATGEDGSKSEENMNGSELKLDLCEIDRTGDKKKSPSVKGDENVIVQSNESDSHNLSTASFVTAHEDTPNISVNLENTVTNFYTECLDGQTPNTPAVTYCDKNNNKEKTIVNETSESEMDTPRLIEHVTMVLAQTDIQSNEGSELDTPRLLDEDVTCADQDLLPDITIIPCPAGYGDNESSTENVDFLSNLVNLSSSDLTLLPSVDNSVCQNSSKNKNSDHSIPRSASDDITQISLSQLLPLAPDGIANTQHDGLSQLMATDSFDIVASQKHESDFINVSNYINNNNIHSQKFSQVAQHEILPLVATSENGLNWDNRDKFTLSSDPDRGTSGSDLINQSPFENNPLQTNNYLEDNNVEAESCSRDENDSISSKLSFSANGLDASFRSTATDMSNYSVISTLSMSGRARFQNQVDLLKMNQARMEREVNHAKESGEKDQETISSLQKTISLLQDQLVCPSNVNIKESQMPQLSSIASDTKDENKVIVSLHKTIKMLQDQLVVGQQPLTCSKSEGACISDLVTFTSENANDRSLHNSTLKALMDINKCISSAITEDNLFASTVSSEVAMADAIMDRETAIAEIASEEIALNNVLSSSLALENNNSDYESENIHKIVTDLLAQPQTLDPSSNFSLNDYPDFLLSGCNDYDKVSIASESEAEGPGKWQDLATTYLSTDPVVLRLQKSLASAVYDNDNLQGRLKKAAEEVEKKMEQMNVAVTEAREELQKAAKCNEELLAHADGDQAEIDILKDELMAKERALAQAELDRDSLDYKLKETLSVKHQLEEAQSAVKSNHDQAQQLVRAVSQLQRVEQGINRPASDVIRLLTCAALLRQSDTVTTQMNETEPGAVVSQSESAATVTETVSIEDGITTQQEETSPNKANSVFNYREKLIQHAFGHLNLESSELSSMAAKSLKENLVALTTVGLVDVVKDDTVNPSIHDDIMKQSEQVLTNLLLSGEVLDPTLPLNLANWQSVHKSIAEHLAEETNRKVQEELNKRAVAKTDAGTSPTRPRSPKKTPQTKSSQKNNSPSKSAKTNYEQITDEREFSDLLSRIRSELGKSQTNESRNVESSDSDDKGSVKSDLNGMNDSMEILKERDSVSVEVGKRKKRLDIMLEAFTGKRAEKLKANVKRPVSPEFVPQPVPVAGPESPTTVRRRKVESVLDRYGLNMTKSTRNNCNIDYQTKAIPGNYNTTYRPYQTAVLSHNHKKEHILDDSLDLIVDSSKKLVRTSPIMARIKARLKQKVDSFSDTSSALETPVNTRQKRYNGANNLTRSRSSSSLIKPFYTRPRREVYPHKNGYRPCYNSNDVISNQVDLSVDDLDGVKGDIDFQNGVESVCDIREPSSQESFVGGSFRTSSPVGHATDLNFIDHGDVDKYGAIMQSEHNKYDTLRHDTRTDQYIKDIPQSDFSKSLPSRHWDTHNDSRDKLSRSLFDLSELDPNRSSRNYKKSSPKVTFRDTSREKYAHPRNYSTEKYTTANESNNNNANKVQSKWKGMVNNNFKVFSEDLDNSTRYRYEKYNSKYDHYSGTCKDKLSGHSRYGFEFNNSSNTNHKEFNKKCDETEVFKGQEVELDTAHYRQLEMQYHDDETMIRHGENNCVKTYKSLLSPERFPSSQNIRSGRYTSNDEKYKPIDSSRCNMSKSTDYDNVTTTSRYSNRLDIGSTKTLELNRSYRPGNKFSEHKSNNKYAETLNGTTCVGTDKKQIMLQRPTEVQSNCKNDYKNDKYQYQKQFQLEKYKNERSCTEKMDHDLTDADRMFVEDLRTAKAMPKSSCQRRISKESVASDHSDATSASSVDLIVTKSGDIWHRKKHSGEIKLRSPDCSFGHSRRVYQEGDSLREMESTRVEQHKPKVNKRSNSPSSSVQTMDTLKSKSAEINRKTYTSEYHRDQHKNTAEKHQYSPVLDRKENNYKEHNLSVKIDKTLKEYEGSLLRNDRNITGYGKDLNGDLLPSSTQRKDRWHEHLLSRPGKSDAELFLTPSENRGNMTHEQKKTTTIESPFSHSFSAARIFERLKKNREYSIDSVSGDEYLDLPPVPSEKICDKMSDIQTDKCNGIMPNKKSIDNTKDKVQLLDEKRPFTPSVIDGDAERHRRRDVEKNETQSAQSELPSLSEKQRLYADMLIDKYTTIIKQHPETMDTIKSLPTEEPPDSPMAPHIMDLTID